jgi:3',5'-cyclic AMP phosphodiesterase CpdA
MTKVAVISDIHAFHPESGAVSLGERDPSWVRTLPDAMEEMHGPFQALQRLIEEEDLKADFVLSGGDMGDRADQRGITYAWSWLQVIRTRLSANLLVGTTGNHDVDSRDINKTGNPLISTRSLQPPFPVDDQFIRDAYWDDNVAIVSDGDTDIVILNTSAGHEDPVLAQKGLVDTQTLAKLEQLVGTATGSKRILLAHHHPYRHDAINKGDYSALDAGPEMLKVLQDNGSWLVIHGHRHYPNLVYAAGGTQSPVIFASGSFSARLYPELQTRVRNQFHLIDLEGPGSVVGTSGSIGRVRSWEYNTSSGWVQPSAAEGIPDESGFGYRDGVENAIPLVSAILDTATERLVRWEDVLVRAPQLRYMLPIDRAALLDNLVSRKLANVAPSGHFSLRASEIFLSVKANAT